MGQEPLRHDDCSVDSPSREDDPIAVTGIEGPRFHGHVVGDMIVRAPRGWGEPRLGDNAYFSITSLAGTVRAAEIPGHLQAHLDRADQV